MLADFQAALPFLIMSLAVLAFFGSSLVLLVCLMGFYGWERYARIARGLAISASAQGYAAAVVQLGATPLAGLFPPHPAEHRLDADRLDDADLSRRSSCWKAASPSSASACSRPRPSLGNMVGFGREYLTRAPWIMLAPALVIMLTTLSISLVGDWLRDKLDPTVR